MACRTQRDCHASCLSLCRCLWIRGQLSSGNAPSSVLMQCSALLRSEAVRILTKVLGFITVVGPSEKQIFIESVSHDIAVRLT